MTMARVRTGALAAACAVIGASLLGGCGGGCGPSYVDQNGRLIGSWGATDYGVTFTASNTGGELEVDCFVADAALQPIIPAASGDFDVPGTWHGVSPTARPVRYIGTVHGRTMVLSVVDTSAMPSFTIATYTLVAGHHAPPIPPTGGGGCPG